MEGRGGLTKAAELDDNEVILHSHRASQRKSNVQPHISVIVTILNSKMPMRSSNLEDCAEIDFHQLLLAISGIAKQEPSNVSRSLYY